VFESVIEIDKCLCFVAAMTTNLQRSRVYNFISICLIYNNDH
jgi:hypothetical protein